MPKNGMLARISLALAAAAALATVAVSAAGAARTRHDTQRRGQHVRRPARQRVDPARHVEPRHHASTDPRARAARAAASRRSRTRRSTSARATLRSARSPRPAQLLPDPVGALRYGRHLPHPRRQRPAQHDRLGAREDLPRQDHLLERQGDQGAQPGHELPHTAITTVHRDSASGTTYNFTDYLSKASSVQEQGRHGHVPVTGRAHSTQATRQQRRRQRGRATRTARSATSTSTTASRRHLTVHARSRTGRAATSPRRSARSSAAAQARHEARTPTARSRSSTRRAPASTTGRTRSPPTRTSTSRRSRSRPRRSRSSSPGRSRPGRRTRRRTIFVPLPSGVVTFDKKQIKRSPRDRGESRAGQ